MMSTIRERLSEKSNIKQIFMDCGRLTIVSAYHEWVGKVGEKRKVPGVVLEAGDNGYVELDLNREDHAETYRVFREWMDKGQDPRIVKKKVHEIKEGEVKPPFSWWVTSKESQLLKDVARAVEPMGDQADRESFIEQCVLYERQQDNPRESLIESLLDFDVEVKQDDPLNPKVDAS